MLIYRQVMLTIAAMIAEKENARMLLTGDSLSQVASQTLANLAATYATSPMPILSPLVGMNKNEIIILARKIGTFDISALPYGDCCSYFVPKHPDLRITAGIIRREMEKIDASLLEKTASSAIRIKL